jgi:hypothetical protein
MSEKNCNHKVYHPEGVVKALLKANFHAIVMDTSSKIISQIFFANFYSFSKSIVRRKKKQL